MPLKKSNASKKIKDFNLNVNLNFSHLNFSLSFFLKIILVFFLFLILLITPFTIVFGYPKLIYSDSIVADNSFSNISAESFIVFETETGKILCEKNSNEKLYPASLTKMLTAIIAIENAKNLNEVVKISKKASGRNNSFFEFHQGDKISVLDLIKAALISSHNNATIALAEYICGNEEEFVKLMNNKALEIGAKNSFFQNTNGLDLNYKEHKSTAQDLALIANYCLKNEIFREIIAKKSDIIKINDTPMEIYNTNILLFFDYIKGIKTGFTNNAGYCIALYSERADIKTVLIILKSQECKRESDALKLINWVNDNYEYRKIVDSNKEYKLVEISDYKTTASYNFNTKIYTYVYPQKDCLTFINKNTEIKISDDLKQINQNSINTNDFVFIPKTKINLPLSKSQKIASLKIKLLQDNLPKINDNMLKANDSDIKNFENNIINLIENEAIIGLINKENIDKPYVEVMFQKENNNKIKYLLIFLILFYFLIFILIIIKNLISRLKKD